jgi:hypothetical protein
MRHIPLLSTLLILALAACGSEPPEPDAEPASNDYVEAVDKARELEGQLQEAAEKQKRDIEAQEGGEGGG